jgi:hypothetical protein
MFPLPVAASATVAPLIGFPFASRTVTVIVELPLPASMELGAAATVDCDADTAPGCTVTTAVCVMAVPFAVAETVLVPASVEPSVPLAIPLASVGPAGCVSVFPVPVAESTTVAPLIGFPPASLTVTVIVEVALPASMELGAVATVDWAADTGPGFTVTTAVCVSAIPFAVAETVFVPAAVELRVPV